MADTPKLHVYVVAALFSPADVPDGKMITNTWFSQDAHGAAAAVTTRFVQQTGETQPLQTVMVHELTEEWLVAALNAIRTGGKPGEVTPLRVVPEGAPAPDVLVTGMPGVNFARDSTAEDFARFCRPPNGDGDAA